MRLSTAALAILVVIGSAMFGGSSRAAECCRQQHSIGGVDFPDGVTFVPGGGPGGEVELRVQVMFYGMFVPPEPDPSHDGTISAQIVLQDGEGAFCGGSAWVDGEHVGDGYYAFVFPTGGGLKSTSVGSSFLRVQIEMGYPGVPGSPFDAQIPLVVASPDLNADLAVDFSDITLFVSLYAGPYTSLIDLNHDGLIDLSDIALFSGWLDRSCNP